MADQMQRKRASSRSRRIVGSGSQIAGTKSRCESTASTRASILSVVHANGASPVDLLRVRDQHLPTKLLQRVVHEPRPVHRLDHRPHPRRGNPPGEMAQPVRVRRGRKLRDQLPGIVDQAHVQSTSTQIQSSVQHEGGPPR
jgi:hypothetical protein